MSQSSRSWGSISWPCAIYCSAYLPAMNGYVMLLFCAVVIARKHSRRAQKRRPPRKCTIETDPCSAAAALQFQQKGASLAGAHWRASENSLYQNRCKFSLLRFPVAVNANADGVEAL